MFYTKDIVWNKVGIVARVSIGYTDKQSVVLHHPPLIALSRDNLHNYTKEIALLRKNCFIYYGTFVKKKFKVEQFFFKAYNST